MFYTYSASHFGLATFQALSSHLWLAATLYGTAQLKKVKPAFSLIVLSGKWAYLKVIKCLNSGTKGKMQTYKAGAEMRDFRECQIMLTQTHDSLSQQNQAFAGLQGNFSGWGTLGLLPLWLPSGDAPLSAWEMELFETDPGFQLPGPRAPSAKHQERGRFWKHICQPALMVSGTSPSLAETRPPTLEEATLTGLNSSWLPTGGYPGTPLEVAAPKGSPPLSGIDWSVCSAALLMPTAPTSPPSEMESGAQTLETPTDTVNNSQRGPMGSSPANPNMEQGQGMHGQRPHLLCLHLLF